MITPEQILEIADKNGWIKTFIEEAVINKYEFHPSDLPGSYVIKCLLATNKGFRQSLQQERIKRRSGSKFMALTFLIDDLLENDGDNFWKICSEFIGENNE